MPATNINMVIVTGNLTADPELKETSNGTPVCELRIASNASIKKEGNWTTKTNYFPINTWGAQAENVSKYLTKGSKIGVEGRLEYQSWESKEGKKQSRLVITAKQIEFLSKPKSAGSGSTEDPPEGFEEELPFA